jgi:hypothetical protein
MMVFSLEEESKQNKDDKDQDGVRLQATDREVAVDVAVGSCRRRRRSRTTLRSHVDDCRGEKKKRRK